MICWQFEESFDVSYRTGHRIGAFWLRKESICVSKDGPSQREFSLGFLLVLLVVCKNSSFNSHTLCKIDVAGPFAVKKF